MDENTPRSPTNADTARPSEVTDKDRLLFGAPPPHLRGERKRTLGTWLWPGIILVVVVIGVLYIIGHNNDQPAGPQGRGGRRGGNANGFIPVNAVAARAGDMPTYLDALGTVTPTATVTVRSQVSGVLQSVNFAEGQMVSKGQVLAQVDPRAFQAALMQAQGNLARDEAQLAAARVDLQRYRTLLAQNSISAQQVDQQAAQVGQLEGSVQSDRANVQTQSLNLSYARITAPIGGRVGLRQVDPGNYVSTGDSNGIVAITQQSPIDVTFTIPEDQVQTVTQRLRAGNRLPVYVLDRVQSNTLATGALVSTDNLIDATTGTLRAKARFDNTAGALFPSQFVNVRILVDTLRNVVLVPPSAILRGQQGLFVYVADAKGAVHVTPVQTGATANDQTAILSGLQAGQQVVTDGTDRLREGACVVIPGPDGSAAGGGQGRGQGAGQGNDATQEKKPGFFGSLFGGAASSSAAGGRGGKGGQSPCGGGGKHGGEARAGSENAPGAASGHAAQGLQAQGSQPGNTPAAGAPAVSGTPAAAQGPTNAVGHAGGQRGGGAGRTAAMLAQLDLTPDQQARASAIIAQSRQQAQTATDPDAKRQVWIASMRQIESILTPAQQAKLKQLRAAQRAQNGGGNGGNAGLSPSQPQ